MPVLHKLDLDAVRLIGSTEVIQSPVAVVKELAENSLDAGATRISVRLENFGLDLVEVADNGNGIDSDSMPMLCQHHCTSKATSAPDILEGKVDTYGFRGEALASIAAVSGSFSVTTCCPGEPIGRRYIFEFRSHDFSNGPSIVAMQGGTVIAASKLFSRFPVRRDYYMKSKVKLKEILTQCRHLIAMLSMCKVHCRFSLKHGSQNLWESSASMSVPTLLSLVGGPLVSSEDFKHLCVESIFPGHDLECYLPVGGMTPERQGVLFRSSPDCLYILVNNRPIKDKDLEVAIKAAYSESEQLVKSAYPIACLRFTVPRDMLDVNVDVAKTQVNFEIGKDRIAESLKNEILAFLMTFQNLDNTVNSSHFDKNRRRNVEISFDDDVHIKCKKTKFADSEISNFQSPKNVNRGTAISNGKDQPIQLFLSSNSQSSSWLSSLPSSIRGNHSQKSSATINSEQPSNDSLVTLSSQLSHLLLKNSGKIRRKIRPICNDLISLAEMRSHERAPDSGDLISALQKIITRPGFSSKLDIFRKIGILSNHPVLILAGKGDPQLCASNYSSLKDFKVSSNDGQVLERLVSCSLLKLAESALFDSMMSNVHLPKRSLGHNFSLRRYISDDDLVFISTLQSKESNPPLFNVVTDHRLVANGFKLRVYASKTTQLDSYRTNNFSEGIENTYIEVEQAPELPEPWTLNTQEKIGSVVREIVTSMRNYKPLSKMPLHACRPGMFVEYFKGEVERMLSVRDFLSEDINNQRFKNDEIYLDQVLSQFSQINDLLSVKCPHSKPIFQRL